MPLSFTIIRNIWALLAVGLMLIEKKLIIPRISFIDHRFGLWTKRKIVSVIFTLTNLEKYFSVSSEFNH